MKKGTTTRPTGIACWPRCPTMRSYHLCGALTHLQCGQVLLHTGIVYPKELSGTGNHIDIEVFPLGPLLVHKKINRIVQRAML